MSGSSENPHSEKIMQIRKCPKHKTTRELDQENRERETWDIISESKLDLECDLSIK